MIGKRLAAHKIMLLLRSSPATTAAIFEEQQQEESIDNLINSREDGEEEKSTSYTSFNDQYKFPLLRCKEREDRRGISRDLLVGYEEEITKSTTATCGKTRKQRIILKRNSRVVDQPNCTTINIIMTVLSIQIFILFFFISFKSNVINGEQNQRIGSISDQLYSTTKLSSKWPQNLQSKALKDSNKDENHLATTSQVNFDTNKDRKKTMKQEKEEARRTTDIKANLTESQLRAVVDKREFVVEQQDKPLNRTKRKDDDSDVDDDKTDSHRLSTLNKLKQDRQKGGTINSEHQASNSNYNNNNENDNNSNDSSAAEATSIVIEPADFASGTSVDSSSLDLEANSIGSPLSGVFDRSHSTVNNQANEMFEQQESSRRRGSLTMEKQAATSLPEITTATAAATAAATTTSSLQLHKIDSQLEEPQQQNTATTASAMDTSNSESAIDSSNLRNNPEEQQHFISTSESSQPIDLLRQNVSLTPEQQIMTTSNNQTSSQALDESGSVFEPLSLELSRNEPNELIGAHNFLQFGMNISDQQKEQQQQHQSDRREGELKGLRENQLIRPSNTSTITKLTGLKWPKRNLNAILEAQAKLRDTMNQLHYNKTLAFERNATPSNNNINNSTGGSLMSPNSDLSTSAIFEQSNSFENVVPISNYQESAKGTPAIIVSATRAPSSIVEYLNHKPGNDLLEAADEIHQRQDNDNNLNKQQQQQRKSNGKQQHQIAVNDGTISWGLRKSNQNQQNNQTNHRHHSTMGSQASGSVRDVVYATSSSFANPASGERIRSSRNRTLTTATTISPAVHNLTNLVTLTTSSPMSAAYEDIVTWTPAAGPAAYRAGSGYQPLSSLRQDKQHQQHQDSSSVGDSFNASTNSLSFYNAPLAQNHNYSDYSVELPSTSSSTSESSASITTNTAFSNGIRYKNSNHQDIATPSNEYFANETRHTEFTAPPPIQYEPGNRNKDGFRMKMKSQAAKLVYSPSSSNQNEQQQQQNNQIDQYSSDQLQSPTQSSVGTKAKKTQDDEDGEEDQDDEENEDSNSSSKDDQSNSSSSPSTDTSITPSMPNILATKEQRRFKPRLPSSGYSSSSSSEIDQPSYNDSNNQSEKTSDSSREDNSYNNDNNNNNNDITSESYNSKSSRSKTLPGTRKTSNVNNSNKQHTNSSALTQWSPTLIPITRGSEPSSIIESNNINQSNDQTTNGRQDDIIVGTRSTSDVDDGRNNDQISPVVNKFKSNHPYHHHHHSSTNGGFKSSPPIIRTFRVANLDVGSDHKQPIVNNSMSFSGGLEPARGSGFHFDKSTKFQTQSQTLYPSASGRYNSNLSFDQPIKSSSWHNVNINNNQQQSINGYSQQATTKSNFIPQNPNYQSYNNNNNFQPNLQPFNQIQHHDTSMRSNSFTNNYYRPQAHYERNNPMQSVRHPNFPEEQQRPDGSSFRQPSTTNSNQVSVQPVRSSPMYEQQSVAYQRASDLHQANSPQQNNASWSIVTLPYPQPASQAHNYFSIYQNDKSYPQQQQQQQSSYDNRYRIHQGSLDDQRRPSTMWFNNAEPSSFQSTRASFGDSSSNQRLTDRPIQQQTNSMMYNMPAPYLSGGQQKSSPSESQLVQRGTRDASGQSAFMHSTSSGSNIGNDNNSGGNGNDYVTINLKTHSAIGPNQLFWEAAAREVAQSSSQKIKNSNDDQTSKVPVTNGHLPPQHHEPLSSNQLPMMRRPLAAMRYSMGQEPFASGSHTNGHAYAGQLKTTHLAAAAMFDQFNGGADNGFAQLHTMPSNPHELSYVSPQSFLPMSFAPPNHQMGETDSFNYMSAAAAMPASAFAALPSANDGHIGVPDQDSLVSPSSMMATPAFDFGNGGGGGSINSLANNYSSNNDSRFLKKGTSVISAALPLATPSAVRDAFGWPMGYGSEAAKSLLKVNHVAPPPSYLIPAKVTAAQTSALLYPTIIDPTSTNSNAATNGLPIKEDPSIITTAPGGPSNLGSLGSYASESSSDFVTWPMIAQNSVVSPQVWPGSTMAQESMISSSQSQANSYQVKPKHIKVELSTRPPPVSRRMKLWQLIRLLGRRNNNLNSNTSNNSTILNSRTSLPNTIKNKRQKRSIVNTIVASLTKQANNSAIGSKLTTIRGRDKMFSSESQTSHSKQLPPLQLPTKLAIVDESDYTNASSLQHHQKMSNSAFIPLIDNGNMIDNIESDLLAQALFYNQQQAAVNAANEASTNNHHLSMANSSPLNMMLDPMMMSASPSMRVVSHTPMNSQHVQQTTIKGSPSPISNFYSNMQQTTTNSNNHNHNQMESSPVVYMPIEESVGLSPPANEPSAFAEMNGNKLSATSSRERLKQLSKSIIKSSKKPLTKLMKMTNLSARLVGGGNSIVPQSTLNNQSNTQQATNNNNNQILGNSASGSQQYFSVAGYKMNNPIIGQNIMQSSQHLSKNNFDDFNRFNSIPLHHQHWYQPQQQQQYQPSEVMDDQFRAVTNSEFAPSHQQLLAPASSSQASSFQIAPYSMLSSSTSSNQSSKQMFPPMVHFNRSPPSQTFNSSPLSTSSGNQQLSKFVVAIPTAISAPSSPQAMPSTSTTTTTTTTTSTTQTPRITTDQQPTQSAIAPELVSNASFGNPLSAADEISPSSVFYLDQPNSQRRLINVSSNQNNNSFKPMLNSGQQEVKLAQNSLSRAMSDLQFYENHQLANIMPLLKFTKTFNSNLSPEVIPPHRSSLAYEPIMRLREKQVIFPRPPKRDYLLSNPARRVRNNLGEYANHFGDISTTVRRQASEFDDRFHASINTTPIFRANTQSSQQPSNFNNTQQNESSRSIYSQNSNHSLSFDLAQLNSKQAISNMSPHFNTPKQQSVANSQHYIFTQTKPKLRIQVGHQLAGFPPQVLVRPKMPFKQNSVILNTFKPSVKTTRQFTDNTESGALSLLYGKNSAKNSSDGAFSETANEMFANSMETALSNQDLPKNDLEAAKMLVANNQNQLTAGDQSSSQLDENSFNSLMTSASTPIEDPASLMPDQAPNGASNGAAGGGGGNLIVDQKPGENVGENVQLGESSNNNGDFTLEQQQQFQHSLNQQQLQNQMFQMKPNLAYQINPSNLPKPRLPKFIPSINSMASKFRQHLFQTLRLNPLGSRWPTMLGSATFMTYPKFQPNSNLMIPLPGHHHQLEQQQMQQSSQQQQQFMPQASNQHGQQTLDGYNFAPQAQMDDSSMRSKLSAGFQEPATQANQFVSQQQQQQQQQFQQHQKQLMLPSNRLNHMRPHNFQGPEIVTNNKHPTTMQLDDSGLATGEDGRLIFPENGNIIDGEGSHHATSSSSSIPTMEREPNLLAEFSTPTNSSGTNPQMMMDEITGGDIYDQELMTQQHQEMINQNATNEFNNQLNEQQVAELSESAAPPAAAPQPARNVMTDVSNNLVTSDGTYIPEEQAINPPPTNQEKNLVNASSSIRDDRREAPPPATPQAPFQTQSQHEQQAQALRNNVPMDGNITIHHHHVIAPDDLDSENKMHEMQIAIRNQQQQHQHQQPRQLKSHQQRSQKQKQQQQPDHQLDSLESGDFNYNQDDMHSSNNTRNEHQDNNSVSVDLQQHFNSNNNNQHDNSSFDIAHYEPERVAPHNRKYQSTASMVRSKKVLMNYPTHQRDLTNSAASKHASPSSRGRPKEVNTEFSDSQTQLGINQNHQQINADYQVIKASRHHQVDGSPQSMMANETADISEFPQVFHSSAQNSMINSNDGINGFNTSSSGFINDEQGGTTISVNSDSQDDSSEDQQQQLVGQQVYEPDSQTVIYGEQAGSEQQLNSFGNLNDDSPSPHSYLDNRVEQQPNKNFALISHHFQPNSNSSMQYDFKPVSTRIPAETNNFSTIKAMSWDHDKIHHIDPFKPVILTANSSSGSVLNNYEAFNTGGEQQPGLRHNTSAIYSQQQRQHSLNSAGVASNHEQYVIVDQPILLTGSQSFPKNQDHNSIVSPINNNSDREHTTVAATTTTSTSSSNLAASNDQPVVFVSAKPEKITFTNNNNRKRPLKLPKSAKARIEASKQEQLMLQAGKPINNQVISGGDQKASEASLSHITSSTGSNSTISVPAIVSNSTNLKAERVKVSQNSVDINIKNHNLKATTVSPVILISRDSSTRAPKAKIRWQGMSGNHNNEQNNHNNNRSSVDTQKAAELNSSETNSRDHAWIVSKMTHQAYAGSAAEQSRQQTNSTNSMLNSNQATVTTEMAPIVVDSPVSESAPATINLGPIASSASTPTPTPVTSPSGNSTTQQQVKHYPNHKQQHSSSYLSDALGSAAAATAKSEPNTQTSQQQSNMPIPSSSIPAQQQQQQQTASSLPAQTATLEATAAVLPSPDSTRLNSPESRLFSNIGLHSQQQAASSPTKQIRNAATYRRFGGNKNRLASSNHKADNAATPTTASPAGSSATRNQDSRTGSTSFKLSPPNTNSALTTPATTTSQLAATQLPEPNSSGSSVTSPMSSAAARASIEEVAEIVHLQPTQQTNSNSNASTPVLNERPTVFTGAINLDLGDTSASSLLSPPKNESSSGFLSRSGNLNLVAAASTTISSSINNNNNKLDDEDSTNFRQHYLKEEDETNNPAIQSDRLSHIRNRRQKERDEEEAQKFHHQRNQQRQTEVEDVDIRIKLITKQNKDAASTMTAAATTATKLGNKRYSSASAVAELPTIETNEMNDMISLAGKHSSD